MDYGVHTYNYVIRIALYINLFRFFNSLYYLKYFGILLLIQVWYFMFTFYYKLNYVSFKE